MPGSPSSAATPSIRRVCRCRWQALLLGHRGRRRRAPLRLRPGSACTAWSRPSSSSAWSPPRARNGQLTIVRIAPKGTTRQEGRPRRRVRSPGAAARGDRQAGRVEAARGGHPQEAGGDQAAGRRRRHGDQDGRERPRAGAARDHQERRAAAHRRGEEHPEPPGGRGEAAQPPQVDRAEARGRGRRARHPRS